MNIRPKGLATVCLLVAVMVTAAGPLASRAMAGPSLNLNSAKQAIETITRFPAAISKARATIASAPVGPWKLDVHCSYCSKTFIVCIQTTKSHYWWPVSFDSSRSYLNRVVQRAEENGKQFSSGFVPVQQWLASLPAFSSRFNAASDMLLAVKDEINQGIGPNDAQRVRVTHQIEELMIGMNKGSEQLKRGRSALARLLIQQKEHQNAITRAKDNLVKSAQNILRRMEEFISSKKCGKDKARGQYNGFKAQLDRSIATYSGTLSNLATQTKQTDDAVSLLMGQLTSAVARFQPILQQLKMSQDAPLGGAIQQLRLTVAKAQWQALADYAASQVPAGWRRESPLAIKKLPAGSHPVMPSGLKVTCLSGPDTLKSSKTCPVIQWGNATYWAYSHRDNRSGMTIVKYDGSGKIIDQWAHSGARYIWQITSDPAAKTVTFWGQANQAITVGWNAIQ